MKKFTVIEILFYILLLSGCSYVTKEGIEISNSTDTDVTFTINGYGDEKYTLQPNTSVTKQLYTRPTLNFEGDTDYCGEFSDSVYKVVCITDK